VTAPLGWVLSPAPHQGSAAPASPRSCVRLWEAREGARRQQKVQFASNGCAPLAECRADCQDPVVAAGLCSGLTSKRVLWPPKSERNPPPSKAMPSHARQIPAHPRRRRSGRCARRQRRTAPPPLGEGRGKRRRRRRWPARRGLQSGRRRLKREPPCSSDHHFQRLPATRSTPLLPQLPCKHVFAPCAPNRSPGW
jgi:hypothetical protein